MAAIIRIYAVGAMSGNEAVWRKFVNALALDVYKIDVAIVLEAVEDPGWRALADERLADSPVQLTLAAAADVLDLPGGHALAVAPGAEAIDSETLRRHQPTLAFCGGRTQSAARKFWAGDTLCLDPGSDAARGGLAGYVVDLGMRGVMVARHART